MGPNFRNDLQHPPPPKCLLGSLLLTPPCCLQLRSQVERVVAERPEHARRFLVKWEGLPYAEATWETADSLLAAAGGEAARDAFQVGESEGV